MGLTLPSFFKQKETSQHPGNIAIWGSISSESQKYKTFSWQAPGGASLSVPMSIKMSFIPCVESSTSATGSVHPRSPSVRLDLKERSAWCCSAKSFVKANGSSGFPLCHIRERPGIR